MKTSNRFIKFGVAIVIAAFSAVFLTNTCLSLFSENIGDASAGNNGQQCSFLLPCGFTDVTAINKSQGNNGFVDISIRLNGRKTFETGSGFDHKKVHTKSLANVHYSFSDFDFFVDLVVSTQTKKVIVHGSDGHVTSD